MALAQELLEALAYIAGRMRTLEQRAGQAAEYRQVVVASTDVPTRTYIATLDGSPGPKVYLAVGQTMPTVGEAVWAIRVGTSKWLHHGKLG
jgi:hypothetical protein